MPDVDSEIVAFAQVDRVIRDHPRLAPDMTKPDLVAVHQLIVIVNVAVSQMFMLRQGVR